ncbi:unnamed protein product [Lactuca saligna]|uniref:Uncharacterized protein n=1 Tax=Lactuca saligna TaxID=75948 RepID=A0AA36EAA6_LACSI|nr:unnamed protein product [Lactuca saligna]
MSFCPSSVARRTKGEAMTEGGEREARRCAVLYSGSRDQSRSSPGFEEAEETEGREEAARILLLVRLRCVKGEKKRVDRRSGGCEGSISGKGGFLCGRREGKRGKGFGLEFRWVCSTEEVEGASGAISGKGGFLCGRREGKRGKGFGLGGDRRAIRRGTASHRRFPGKSIGVSSCVLDWKSGTGAE